MLTAATPTQTNVPNPNANQRSWYSTYIAQSVQKNTIIMNMDTLQQYKLKSFWHIIRHDSLLWDIKRQDVKQNNKKTKVPEKCSVMSQAKMRERCKKQKQLAVEFVVNLSFCRRPKRDNDSISRKCHVVENIPSLLQRRCQVPLLNRENHHHLSQNSKYIPC